MNTKLAYLLGCLSTILCTYLQVHPSYHPMIFEFSVQFPASLQTIPDLRVYYAGTIAKGTINDQQHTVNFGIPADRYQNFFTVLVIHPHAIRCTTEDNTVLYWSVAPQAPYSFYTLTLKENLVTAASITHKEPRTQLYWEVKKIPLPYHYNRIPDTTIIVCYDPAFIDCLEGGSCVSLPSLLIKSSVLHIAGSEAKLLEKSNEIFLASMSYDALHATLRQTIKTDYNSKTIITMAA